MELPSHFERFLRNISVDEPKLSRIRSEHMALSRALRIDQTVGPAKIETFLQGSYVHGTAIRPLGRIREYDVDVCCLLDLAAVPNGTEEPRRLVRWLARRLKRIEAYRGGVSTRPRCIRIDFPGDFHLDVVLLVEDSRVGSVGLLVPNRGIDGWESTNPKGLARWYHRQNDRTNGRFTRVVRMLKHWRNQAFSATVRPSSVGFEVIVANSWPYYANSDASVVSGVLRQCVNLFMFSRPTAMNPSLPNEDLLKPWSHEYHEVFKTEVASAADVAEDALRETHEGRSIGQWQRLFRRRFPQQG